MKMGTEVREQDLDDLFAEMQAQAPLTSAPLMARILADAQRYQPQPQALMRGGPVPRKSGVWAAMAGALGGRRVLAGLGSVAMAGVMLGFVQPASFVSITDTIFAQTPLDEMDLLPGIDAILTEG